MAVHPCTAQEALINQSFPSCRHERYGAGNHRWLSRIRAWVVPGVYVRTGAFGRVDPRPRSHRLRLWTAPGDRGVSWWGLLLGGTFGFLLGGPIGALLGAAAGRLVGSAVRNLEITDATETPVERVQMAFFAAVFGVMGHVAKADGRVSPEEIRLATQVMDQLGLDAEQRRLARGLFNAGKQPDFPLDGVLDQLRRECGRSLNLVRMFLEMQIQAAGADGTIHTPGPLPRVRAAPPGRATGPPPRRARRAPPALAAPRPVCAAPSVPPATSRPPGRCRRRQCPGRRLSPSRRPRNSRCSLPSALPCGCGSAPTCGDRICRRWQVPAAARAPRAAESNGPCRRPAHGRAVAAGWLRTVPRRCSPGVRPAAARSIVLAAGIRSACLRREDAGAACVRTRRRPRSADCAARPESARLAGVASADGLVPSRRDLRVALQFRWRETAP